MWPAFSLILANVSLAALRYRKNGTMKLERRTFTENLKGQLWLLVGPAPVTWASLKKKKHSWIYLTCKIVCRFSFWSGYIPKLQARLPGQRAYGRQLINNFFFSVSPLLLFLSLKINEHILGWGLKQNKTKQNKTSAQSNRGDTP